MALGLLPLLLAASAFAGCGTSVSTPLPTATATPTAGVAVDPKSHHGFCSSSPVVMWDTKTLATIKTIDVQGNPDGILFDPFNQRVYVWSHSAPNATV